MTRDTILGLLQRSTPTEFVEAHIFDRIPALFRDNRQQYVDWKRTLASKIEVDAACITLVGSAAVGVSLNPAKGLKVFDEQSDIDVAVISPFHFSSGWRYLRMNGARRLRVDRRTLIAWDEHVRRYIYWGTLATDRLLGVLPFGHDWLKATADMAAFEPTVGRSINLRIYADHDSLRAYQVAGIRALRDSNLE